MLTIKLCYPLILLFRLVLCQFDKIPVEDYDEYDYDDNTEDEAEDASRFARNLKLPYIGLVKSDERLCSACLIRPNWAVTSANCLYGLDADNVTVYFGVNYMKDREAISARASQLFLHPDYTENSIEDDIGLIFFKLAIDLSQRVKVMPLILYKWVDSPIMRCEAAGINANNFITTVSAFAAKGSKQCLCLSDERFICAKEVRIGSECITDTGGPLICGNHLYGIRIGPYNKTSCKTRKENIEDLIRRGKELADKIEEKEGVTEEVEWYIDKVEEKTNMSTESAALQTTEVKSQSSPDDSNEKENLKSIVEVSDEIGDQATTKVGSQNITNISNEKENLITIVEDSNKIKNQNTNKVRRSQSITDISNQNENSARIVNLSKSSGDQESTIVESQSTSDNLNQNENSTNTENKPIWIIEKGSQAIRADVKGEKDDLEKQIAEKSVVVSAEKVHARNRRRSPKKHKKRLGRISGSISDKADKKNEISSNKTEKNLKKIRQCSDAEIPIVYTYIHDYALWIYSVLETHKAPIKMYKKSLRWRGSKKFPLEVPYNTYQPNRKMNQINVNGQSSLSIVPSLLLIQALLFI